MFLLQSCTNESRSPKYRIGFSQCGDADKWRKSMLTEMNRELTFFPELELIYKQADDNSSKQVKQVKELLAENIDLLIISPNEAQPLTPIVEEVFNKGIPVIVVDRKIASTLYTNYIGADNYQIGKMAGEYVASLLKQKGNIIEVTGLPASSPAIDRERGFRDGIKPFPDLKIIQKLNGGWVKPKAKQAIAGQNEQLLRTDLIFAQNDVMALGAYEAAKNAGNDQVKIIGVDALPGSGAGMEFISDKILTASLLYPTGGAESIRNALKILNHQSLPKLTILQTLVVDSTNVQMMKLQSDKISSQQKDIEQQSGMITEQKRVYNNQQTFVYILACLLGLAIFLGSLLFYSRRLNKMINKKLAHQNEEISHNSEKLVEMSAKAEAAHEAKLNFFTNISHEFRTPLTLITGPAEEMLKHPKLLPPVRQQLSLIHNNAMRLLRLVNQLMDFRKIEFNKMKVRVAETDLVSFINDIVLVFHDLAAKRNIDCRLLTKERSLPVWIDVGIMDQVLFNLLSNAFKFTDYNGSVLVSIEKNNETNQAILQVEDTGIGMTEEDQQHAFEVFYQGDHDNHKGSGLGLALTKELVTLHHGSITVKSKKGKGSVFTINIPLGKKHFEEDEVKEQTTPDYLHENETNFLFPDLFPVRAFENTEEQKEVHVKESTILIIEDNPELRQFLKIQLADNYEIVEADNGITGLQLAFDNLPDLIICDIMLPGKDGITLTNQLKGDIRTGTIPVILLTAKASAEQQAEGMKCKADAYITKPFNFSFLENSIISLLANRYKLKEYFSSGIPAEIRSSGHNQTERKFIATFKAIVENNIANDKFAIEDICKQMTISKVQLHRKIRSLLNSTINEYILTVRLQKAKYYLRHEELSIAEVAYKTGFSSPAYFSTVFKTKLGVSPTVFKERPVETKAKE
ncbi:MAG TPA: substrate-binding domain-containing protein [Niabella sp.]|nr:substrate-binding domain-containing protein [Niabella sp.]HRB34319.1 substrate-binding domain-containing protein [Niabella sp.]HRB75215.1 substrate-binding domain-containing protein [Niabella sp.]HRB87747.1 substrate-binding domain-containing protein [Niabella sp.]HRC05196.1 substrate-binding domain-containing protein [Niabella sp.]